MQKDKLLNLISFKEYGERVTKEGVIVTKGANIDEDMCLQLLLEANFVPTFFDCEKMRFKLMEELPKTVKDVKLKFAYKGLIQDNDEALKLYMGHLYRGDLLPIKMKNFVHAAKYDGQSKCWYLFTVDANKTRELNSKYVSTIEGLISEALGFEAHVKFIFDESMHNSLAEEMKPEEAIKDNCYNGKKAGDLHEKATSYNNASDGRKAGGKGKGFIYGKRKIGKTVPYSEVKISQDWKDTVSVEGQIFYVDTFHSAKSNKEVVTIYITDDTASMGVKLFANDEEWKLAKEEIKVGNYIKVLGTAKNDPYSNDLIIVARSICPDEKKYREDNYPGKKRVELHAHTKMSSMDGLNDVATLVGNSARWGHTAVAITDHGVVQSFPDAASEADKWQKKGVDIKIIYGLEGYFFDDSDCKNEDGSIDYKSKRTNHIILLAKNLEGLKNLYKMVSISHLDYFYKKPRLPKSVITAHRDGIIIGSACEAGEVYQAVKNGKSVEELEKIAEFYDYLEIQPLINNRFMIENGIVSGNEDLKALNKRIVELGSRMGKPVVATTDAHYDEPTSAIYRNILMAGMGYKDAEQGQGLYMRTTEEMLNEFSYLGEEKAYEVVVENSNKISDMIEKMRPVPSGKFPPKIEGADQKLYESCMEKAHSIYGNPLPKEIGERLEKELSSIIKNGYAVMYVSAQMLVEKSLKDGYLVGSRGSVGSSFAATMAGITEVNPLEPHYICPDCKYLEWGDLSKYNCGIDMPVKKCPVCGTELKRDGFTIPFATFLGFEGDKEPDIDLNFAGEYQATAHKYVGEIFGEKNVYKAGTVSTVAEKTAYGYVRKFHDETAQQTRSYEVERLVQGCTGVKRTTGQHPGGIIIVPDDHEIYEFCPVQHPADDKDKGIITTHFDYHKIDQNLLKLDILGHTVPSMIRHLEDMTGIDPLTIELTDPNVLSIFRGVEALNIKDEDYNQVHGSYGIPEFGTDFVRKMLDDTSPSTFSDLVRISGFSHGTDVWLNNAQYYIKQGIATMNEVISTRDDIMNYLLLKGLKNKDAFTIMEIVRKNKPISDDQLALMKEHGVPDWYIDSCIKIKYMFPRAHAVAYVMMAVRMAWYKVYYPLAFYAAHLSSVVEDFDLNTVLEGKVAIKKKMAEIHRQEKPTAKDKNKLLVYEIVLEMLARGYEFEKPLLGVSDPLKFNIHEGKVLIPYIAIDGFGETASKMLHDEYEKKPFISVEDAVARGRITKAGLENLNKLGVFHKLGATDQISFF